MSGAQSDDAGTLDSAGALDRAEQACERCRKQKVKCVPSGLTTDRCERYANTGTLNHSRDVHVGCIRNGCFTYVVHAAVAYICCFDSS